MTEARPPESTIFISYRRDDTAGFAGRLYDRLADRFSGDRVFMDIDTIRPGHEFAADIEQALSECAACIVLIGPRWTTIASADGGRRLDDPTDFVRLEVAAAIRRGVPLFPVLVDGAASPPAASLPEEIRGVAARQSIELSSERWNYDVGRLLLALDEATGRATKRRTRRHRPPTWVALTGAALLIVATGALVWLWSSPEAADDTTTGACGRAPLCGIYEATLDLVEFEGYFAPGNELWGVADPRIRASEAAWTAQEWVFGPPGPKAWTITAMPRRDGALRPDGTYIDIGDSVADCADAEPADVTRQLSVQSPPANGSDFEGQLRISWVCEGREPLRAVFEVAGVYRG
jgi:TIR domain